MTESYYQSKLIKHFNKEGWFVLKLINTNKNGIPDLQLTHPQRPTVWIECKTDDGKLSKTQKFRRDELLKMGFIHIVAKPKEYEQIKEQVRAYITTA